MGRTHFHQNSDKRSKRDRQISAQELGNDFAPNRAQRRQYVRDNTPRNARLHLVGFGRWRRPRAGDYESFARQTALFTPPVPRQLRRRAMIELAKRRRYLVRIQEKGKA